MEGEGRRTVGRKGRRKEEGRKEGKRKRAENKNGSRKTIMAAQARKAS